MESTAGSIGLCFAVDDLGIPYLITQDGTKIYGVTELQVNAGVNDVSFISATFIACKPHQNGE